MRVELSHEQIHRMMADQLSALAWAYMGDCVADDLLAGPAGNFDMGESEVRERQAIVQVLNDALAGRTTSDANG